MNRFKGRVETATKGYVPRILDFDGDYVMEAVMDGAYVEYGTGCWLDRGSNPDVALEAQQEVFQLMCGGVPEGHFVFNTCSDYRTCYNPHCLASMPVPDYEE